MGRSRGLSQVQDRTQDRVDDFVGLGTEPTERPRVVPSAPSTGRRDVIMPRVAVISWSLFVLLALFLAFVAGLLIGHFIWRTPA